jgi:hypothetical protein
LAAQRVSQLFSLLDASSTGSGKDVGNAGPRETSDSAHVGASMTKAMNDTTALQTDPLI